MELQTILLLKFFGGRIMVSGIFHCSCITFGLSLTQVVWQWNIQISITHLIHLTQHSFWKSEKTLQRQETLHQANETPCLPHRNFLPILKNSMGLLNLFLFITILYTLKYLLAVLNCVHFWTFVFGSSDRNKCIVINVLQRA